MASGRKLYINSKVIEGDASFKKVDKELPRGRKSFNLYEYEVSEEFFRQKHSNIKFEHLLSKQVEGIYETKCPPAFRFLMELGNIIKPVKQKIPKNEQALGRTYKMKEVENRPSPSGYLPPLMQNGELKQIFDRVYLLNV